MLKYNRVSLKLSGEAMGGSETIDFAASARIAREIKTLVEGKEQRRHGQEPR